MSITTRTAWLNATPAQNPRGRRAQSRRGFTLIEIMVAVAIIAVLAAIGLAVGVSVKRNASMNSTKATLNTLQGLMSRFLVDHSDGPPPKGLSGETAWVQALSAFSSKDMESLPSSGSGASKKILDGWGNPIAYVPMNWDPQGRAISSLINGKPGLFYSYGPDGIADNDDDVHGPSVAPQR